LVAMNRTFDVFVSYSSKDKAVAEAVCHGLESSRVRCWIAPRDITPGTEWGEAIIDGIDSTRLVVLVFSGNANASPQVRREMERAVSKGHTIVPFRIESIVPTKAMEYALSSTHWLDALSPPLEQHIQRLVEVTTRFLGLQGVSTANPLIDDGLDKTDSVQAEVMRAESTPSQAAPTHAPSTRTSTSRGRKLLRMFVGFGAAALALTAGWIAYSVSRESDSPVVTYTQSAESFSSNSLSNEPAASLKLAAKAGDVVTNSIGMKLSYIPAGQFVVGTPADDKDPQRSIRISKAFCLSQTEVTQGQWEAVMGTKPWSGQLYAKEGANYPATFVVPEDAMEFCRKLGAREQQEYRLPWEAEWEYACRADTNTDFWFGEESRLGDYGWYFDNTVAIDERHPHVVGQKPANAWGLFDMHGNVWEICGDWFHPDSRRNWPAIDPAGPASGATRVLRGGGWACDSGACNATHRAPLVPIGGDRLDFTLRQTGFRVVLGLPSSAQ
jgi:formylglycine-generating enzyme required for sulfatase activity